MPFNMGRVSGLSPYLSVMLKLSEGTRAVTIVKVVIPQRFHLGGLSKSSDGRKSEEIKISIVSTDIRIQKDLRFLQKIHYSICRVMVKYTPFRCNICTDHCALAYDAVESFNNKNKLEKNIIFSKRQHVLVANYQAITS